MKILITGGLGYVGGRLAGFWKEKRPQSKIFLTTTRSQHPEWSKDFVVLPLDLADADSIKKCIQQSRPDAIVHLGAMDQIAADKDPDQALLVNAQGTKRLLEAATATDVKQFVYFSTFQVYVPLTGKVTEEYPTQPKRPYPVSKLEGERYVQEFGKRGLMQTVIFRLSNAYGPPMDYIVSDAVKGLVFNAFAMDCFAKGEIAPRGNPYRDFITMEDVVRAVDYFLFEIFGQWQEEIFNLGGHSCLSIMEVAQKVADVYERYYQKRIPIKPPLDEITGDRFQFCVDKLARTGFQWKADQAGEILRTLEWAENKEAKLQSCKGAKDLRIKGSKGLRNLVPLDPQIL